MLTTCMDNADFLTFIGLLPQSIVEWVDHTTYIIHAQAQSVIWTWSEHKEMWCYAK